MTHSTKGGGRSGNPDTAADKSKQHNQAPSMRGADDQQNKPQESSYRGSGDGAHGGGGGGTPRRATAASAKGASNRGKGSGTGGH